MMQFKRIRGQVLVPKAWRGLAVREKAALVRELSQVAELGCDAMARGARRCPISPLLYNPTAGAVIREVRHG